MKMAEIVRWDPETKERFLFSNAGVWKPRKDSCCGSASVSVRIRMHFYLYADPDPGSQTNDSDLFFQLPFRTAAHRGARRPVQ